MLYGCITIIDDNITTVPQHIKPIIFLMQTFTMKTTQIIS